MLRQVHRLHGQAGKKALWTQTSLRNFDKAFWLFCIGQPGTYMTTWFLAELMAVSAHLAGVSGFRAMFWTGYTEMMFVNAGDFFLLDVLARIYVKDKGLIKGAENHHDWEWKGWWKLAVPEHGLAWPVLVCPLTGLIVAGFAALM